MQKLIVFNHISLDGYFVDQNGSMNWAKSAGDDPEYNAFVAENASGGGSLLFGRVTYELMIKYWPTPMAKQHAPEVAAGMNNAPKFVFSRTLDHSSWNNTRMVKGDLGAEVRKIKEKPGNGIAILGSGTITSQLAPTGLIDDGLRPALSPPQWRGRSPTARRHRQSAARVRPARPGAHGAAAGGLSLGQAASVRRCRGNDRHEHELR